MAELEAGGYLVQPHTSAGRVPSDAGYRTYVDRLMQPEALTKDDTRRIRDEFREASRELGDVIDQTTRLLSGLSGNLAIAIAPSRDSHAFKHVQLIWLSARTSIVVVVTSGGVAAQRVFEWRADVAADDLTRLSNALNARLGGRVMEDVAVADLDAVCAELGVSARDPRRGARRVRAGAPDRGARDRRRRRAEPARPARVPRPAQAARDPAHRRGAAHALRPDRRRARRRRPDRSRPARAHRPRAARRRALRVQRRHRPVPLRRPRRRDARDPRAAPHALRPAHRARVGNGASLGDHLDDVEIR